MKFSLGVAAALAGLAVAQEPADVYIMKASAKASVEDVTLPRSIAQLIFMERLAPSSAVASLDDIPEDTREAAVSFINKFGRAPQPLFTTNEDAASQDPPQLLLMLEGATQDNMQHLYDFTRSVKPTFQVVEPPSSAANQDLTQKIIPSVGVDATDCDLEQAINPINDGCWTSGKALVASYDIEKNPSVTKSLADNLGRVSKLVESGNLEITLVVLPETSRSSSINSWSPLYQPLRSRQFAEAVLSESETGGDKAQPTSTNEKPFVISANVKDEPIPACFASQESCENATNQCSGRGECADKYGKSGGDSCFACHCKNTENPSGSKTHWAGPTCNKQDISMQFWLFASVTLLLVFMVTASVSLLYSVGEEKLPGVIGAGVSKK